MANSEYEHVRLYEHHPTLLPSTYIVVRIDGRGFHHVSNKYGFQKPNDRRALDLMNAAATAVLREISDISFAYGVSDEFSFIFDRTCTLFRRRESKIVTTIVSTFTAYYINLWPLHFPDKTLSAPLPTFDGRAVLYPNDKLLREYMSWRQVDCKGNILANVKSSNKCLGHVNNLFNTTFWALVSKGGLSPSQAEGKLKGTSASQKNEILFSTFGINYNNEPEIFKKGSVLFRNHYDEQESSSHKHTSSAKTSETLVSKTQQDKEQNRGGKAHIELNHVDIINDTFWENKSWLLSREVV